VRRCDRAADTRASKAQAWGEQIMKIGIHAAAALSVLIVSGPAFAVGNSWWGGEIQANQNPGRGNGFGYGRYEAAIIPSTGAGSITGFFNLCYGDDNYSNCVPYNPDEPHHFEVDGVEFTPTGNDPQNRRWIRTCLKDDDCNVQHPDTPPRVGDNLKAASLNTFPNDNQVYAFLDFNPYGGYHTYQFQVLPDKVIWSIDGKQILSRTTNASIGIRRLDANYARFDQLLRNGQVKLVINVWDGTQGQSGGFGGKSSVQQTTGVAAKIQRVAYYPATCSGSTCKISDNPSFLADFANKKFVKNGQAVTINPQNNLCTPADGAKSDTLWLKIARPDYPVYTSTAHVTCDLNSGIQLFMKNNPD
jgi:hypothetical protein